MYHTPMFARLKFPRVWAGRNISWNNYSVPWDMYRWPEDGRRWRMVLVPTCGAPTDEKWNHNPSFTLIPPPPHFVPCVLSTRIVNDFSLILLATLHLRIPGFYICLLPIGIRYLRYSKTSNCNSAVIATALRSGVPKHGGTNPIWYATVCTTWRIFFFHEAHWTYLTQCHSVCQDSRHKVFG
jgi:hypothetical protein